MATLTELFDRNFIEYASYVIKDRAIPDALDGLKPVQRRIFHSMYEMDDGKYNKVANIVGNTMKYHPHGDASIGSALVVLANKEYFIDKQGNFGNILTGDEASAARYIECRLNSLAREVLFHPDVTEYVESYDGRNKEPVALPAKIPVLLLIGAEGIAVGMSTKILPHNFNEVLKAQIALLEGKEEVKLFPDFQQGGIMDVTDYKDGMGKVRVRAKIEIKNDKTLMIREIPYGSTTESVISSIEAAAKKNQIKISSISDFTTERIEIEIKSARGESVEDLIPSLYAFTECEQVINVNLIAIVENKPKFLTVTELLKYNTEQLKKILDLELKHREEKLSEQLHQLTLEQIFIENRIYQEIEEMEEYSAILNAVRSGLEKFHHLFIRKLTEEDIERLLEIKIKKISRYDMNKNRKNRDDILKELKAIRFHLAHLKAFAVAYLQGILKKYGSSFPRKTKIDTIKTVSVKELKQPDNKVFWNRETGFIGTEVKSDLPPLVLSPQDKMIVFRQKGVFKIIPVDGKIFVDTDILYLDTFDPNRVYTVIYTDTSTGVSFIKRFQVTSFIQNKEYSFVKTASPKVEYFSICLQEKLKVSYVKKPKQKINEEVFDTKELEIKGYSTLGNRFSAKEIEKIQKIEKKNRG